MKTTEKMLEVQMVASRLGVSKSTIYRMIEEGQIEFKQVGRKKAYRIPERAVMLALRYGFNNTVD